MTVIAVWSFTILAKEKRIHFNVDIKNPKSHYCRVKMRCTDFQQDRLNFKLPAWTPVYYWIINFEKNVVKFRARTAGGKELMWEKVDKQLGGNKWTR